MTARQRILAIRLSEKTQNNPKYADKMGITVNFRSIFLESEKNTERKQNNK